MLKWTEWKFNVEKQQNEFVRSWETHVGVVLATRVDVERIMSDVWEDIRKAVVWSDEKNAPETLWVSQGYPSRETASVEIDATPEVQAKYAAWLEIERQKQEKLEAQRRFEARIAEEKRVTRGKRVVVARGRKVPQGTTGIVFWVGDSQWGLKVGIATSERKDARGRNLDVAWTYEKNCDVILPENIVAEIQERQAA
jgi:hypothetical protein